MRDNISSPTSFQEVLVRADSPYTDLEMLGAGGMGVVYRAYDRQRDRTVALKTLHGLDAETLLHLKSEFRATTDIQHDNLVRLYELVSIEDSWFLVMEYIEGRSIRALLDEIAHDTVSDTIDFGPSPSALETMDFSLDDDTGEARSTHAPQGDDARMMPDLESIFGQLSDGIAALHAAGKLHCDIKPGNVMVSDSGRVVLLDFGLIRDQRQQTSGLSGTPAYIAPEQLQWKPASTASDWYAFGTMLYEALCGRLPYPGSTSQVIRNKPRLDPPELPPIPQSPPGIRALCERLLSRDPALRPDGDEVRAAFGRTTSTSIAPFTEAFVGREDHLQALAEAWEEVERGQTVIVDVHGTSGTGKSALLSHFFQHLRASRGAVVLTGRCYERETVPYKALDSLIDSLTEHLIEQRWESQLARIPHLSDLIRVFPVLRRALADEALDAEPTRDLQQRRRRAFNALRELLVALSAQTPLLLCIDDVQWGDRDSGQMLDALLAVRSDRPSPALMMLSSYRSDEAADSPFLSARMLENTGLKTRTLQVNPLTAEQGRRLASLLLGAASSPEQDRMIARESQGLPFFIGELAQHVLAGGEGGRLDDVVMARVRSLPGDAQRLLEAIALAARPVPQELLSTLSTERTEDLIHLLRTRRLVRTFGDNPEHPVESYHDRIRETVAASLAVEEQAGLHGRLAAIYRESRHADPEILATHYFGAGDLPEAGSWALQAGQRAADALAFDAAAGHFERALQCLPGRQDVAVLKADALVNAGRMAEAAEIYLAVAGQEEAPDKKRALLRQAAEQFLVSGRIQEGLDVLQPLLQNLRLPYPKSPGWALFGMIGRMMALDVQGIDLERRRRPSVSPEHIEQIDLCWVAGRGLGSIDVMRGAYYLIRATSLALEAGDAVRAAMGLSTIGLSMISRANPREIPKGRRYLAEAMRLGQEQDNPRVIGMVQVYTGTASMTEGEWGRAHEQITDGLNILEARCTGVVQECSLGRSVLGNVFRAQGEIEPLRQHCAEWLPYSDTIGDLYGEIWLRLHRSTVWLADDSWEPVCADIEELLERMSAPLYTTQHMLAAMLASQAERYSGQPAASLSRLEQAWKPSKKSFALSWEVNQILMLQERASSSLALADRDSARRPALLASVRKDIRAIEKTGRTYGRAYAALLRAGMEGIEGRPEAALAALLQAEQLSDEAGMPGSAACARHRRGVLLAGDEGEALVADAEAFFRRQGIANIPRWLDTFAPGPG